jgi:hypothetical protein
MPYRLLAAATLSLLAACASTPPEGPPAKDVVLAVTQDHQLIRFNAGQPGRVLDRKPLQGLAPGDELVGIDFRIARGVLYALSRQGQLFTVDTTSGRLTRVGSGTPAVALPAGPVGFDFNPAADRIRVVSGSVNLRLHPDTGAAIDGDAALAYAAGDAAAGRTPDVVAAGYTYNKQDDKLTTNYALDRAAGTLVMQGSREGVLPVVSPNSGRLTTVGPLGLGALTDASFDIADVTGAAYAVVRSGSRPRSTLVRVDLASGRGTAVGVVGDGTPLRGMAIAP